MEPFVGQLALFAFNLVPKGWIACNGQLLGINTNQALFSLLGTSFGGDGIFNFALPDLRGRVPMSSGNGFSLGQHGGEEGHVLALQEAPSHLHSIEATSSGSGNPPKGNVLGAPTINIYATTISQTDAMNRDTVAPSGGGGSHENRSPFLAMQWCMATVGIYPSRN